MYRSVHPGLKTRAGTREKTEKGPGMIPAPELALDLVTLRRLA
jgi:hypothetical protein